MDEYRELEWLSEAAGKSGRLSAPEYTAWRNEDPGRASEAPSYRYFVRHFGTWIEACKCAGIEPGSASPKTFTYEEMIEAIREAYEYTEGPFTRALYNRWRVAQDQPVSYPGPSWTRKWDWEQLCVDAGVEGDICRKPLMWTDDEIVSVLSEANKNERGRLSLERYRRWRATQDPDAPSPTTVTKRFGTWADAVERLATKRTETRV
jgi:hypothetical protein